jgi:putative transposase
MHQQKLFQNKFQTSLAYGGELRRRSGGRGYRPLSSREPIHLIFKIHKSALRQRSLRAPRCFMLASRIIKKYAARFYVSIEHCSIQADHIHILIRAPKRAHFHNFFRVVAGQIAQQFENQGWVTDTPQGLWKYRPFSRVIRGWKALKIVRNYISLNECEARGLIPYRKSRLRGLRPEDWSHLRNLESS